jgi:hypothetical protein
MINFLIFATSILVVNSFEIDENFKRILHENPKHEQLCLTRSDCGEFQYCDSIQHLCKCVSDHKTINDEKPCSYSYNDCSNYCLNNHLQACNRDTFPNYKFENIEQCRQVECVKDDQCLGIIGNTTAICVNYECHNCISDEQCHFEGKRFKLQRSCISGKCSCKDNQFYENNNCYDKKSLWEFGRFTVFSGTGSFGYPHWVAMSYFGDEFSIIAILKLLTLSFCGLLPVIYSIRNNSHKTSGDYLNQCAIMCSFVLCTWNFIEYWIYYSKYKDMYQFTNDVDENTILFHELIALSVQYGSTLITYPLISIMVYIFFSVFYTIITNIMIILHKIGAISHKPIYNLGEILDYSTTIKIPPPEEETTEEIEETNQKPIPEKIFKYIYMEDECCVCKDKYLETPDKKVISFTCGHLIHETCSNEFIDINCPLCRISIV